MIEEDRILQLEDTLRRMQARVDALKLMEEAIFQTLIHSEKDMLNKVGKTLRELEARCEKDGDVAGLVHFGRLVEYFEQKRGLPAND